MSTLSPTIILVRPQLAQNVGNIARVMGNFGLQDLRLVAPLPQALNDTALASARGFENILKSAQIYETLPLAIADLNFLYATTARPRNLEKISITCGEIVLEPVKNGIVFGPENCGLSNEEISFCNKIVYIPTIKDPLNIAQAVAIICYELSQKFQSPFFFKRFSDPASSQDLTMFLNNLENELERRNFFQVLEKKKLMQHNIRSIFTRIPFTSQEIKTLRGIITSLTKYKPKDVEI